ncbi:MAG: DUF4280 domain-containing protein [Acetobacteraceae bacterium]
MPELLTTGCMLTCTFGDIPSAFIALELPGKPVIDEAFATATIMEIVPIDNVLPFGMCMSLANPEVAAATTAALGVLTPMPCIPVILDPWEPPSENMLFDDLPLATVESKCLCTWGGEIAVDVPAEFTVTNEP